MSCVSTMRGSSVTDDEVKEKVAFGNVMALVRQLHDGKILTLPSGHKIGMAEDFSMGFVLTDRKTGVESIGGLSYLDLKDLRSVMDKHDIMVIP